MRTDVRIGLAVGGILLAVLIAYVLVVPPIQQPQGQDSAPPPERRRVAALADAPAAETLPAPGARWAMEATTRSVTTAPATSQPTGILANPLPAASSAPAPSSAGTDRSELWDQALSSGRVPVAAAPRLPLAGTSRREAIAQNPTASALPRGGVTSPGSAGAPRTHVVQRGQTLSAIAHMVYGNASHYPAIVRANPGINPNRLRPGQILRLPASPTDATATQLPSIDADLVIASSTPAPALTGTPARAAASSKTSYRVQAGENLHRIAIKLYGSPSHWRRIYDANREAIGPNPGLLRANTVLKLPQAPTVTLAR